MMAALVAAAKGVSVLLLEKTDKPGGSTAFSSRGIRASGSRFQGALGIDDSPEHYARDIFGRNSNESDVPLTKRLTEVSGAVADFLADVACIDFSVGEFVFGHSARRAHSWKEDKTITDFMYEAVEREPNIQVRFSTSVLGFQQADDGTVTGVVTDSGVIRPPRSSWPAAASAPAKSSCPSTSLRWRGSISPAIMAAPAMG